MKKLLLLCVCLLLTLGLFCSACAEVSGDYEYTVLEDGTVCITYYNCKDTNVVFPDTLDGMTVTAIDGDALSPQGAFLKSMTIPDSITMLGDDLLTDCSSLMEIMVSENHPTLELVDGVLFRKTDHCLFFCPDRKELFAYTVPEGTEIIGNFAFSCASGLTEITIPDSVTVIGDAAFLGCENLKSITLPDSVTFIGYSALNGTGLESITIPDSVFHVGRYAFMNADHLKEIVVSENHPTLAMVNNSLISKTEKRLIWHLEDTAD